MQYPYLSFVAENNETASELIGTPFNIGSHIRVGDTVVSAYDDKNVTEGIDDKSKSEISKNHEGNSYGNTISTGFVANMNQMDNNTTVSNCVWTITIPVDNTYVKSADGKQMNFGSGGKMEFKSEPVLSDSNNVVHNYGNIYEVSEISNSTSDNKITLKFKDNLPATLTGDIVVTYGLVIDNLYAPGAQATMSFDVDDEAIDISSDIHSGNLEDYANSVNNPYNK